MPAILGFRFGFGFENAGLENDGPNDRT